MLTQQLSDAIVEHIRQGCPLDVAAELEGVYRTRAYEWLKRGEADEEPYASFRDEVARARAEVTRGVLNEIRTAVYVSQKGNEYPDMRARQWYAERVLGYSPKLEQKVEHSGEVKGLREKTDEELVKLAAKAIETLTPKEEESDGADE